ncbi:hypothetical protein CHELA20_52495 [Hyphomicrobiales bacterium]|nr:hypothetical protein CHELA41_22429 [Hyphomicrobiales bacterium]CAH1682044.1 hypothetical protein CHELA20_52495 [Hyphomicrobiales bacterium]
MGACAAKKNLACSAELGQRYCPIAPYLWGRNATVDGLTMARSVKTKRDQKAATRIARG